MPRAGNGLLRDAKQAPAHSRGTMLVPGEPQSRSRPCHHGAAGPRPACPSGAYFSWQPPGKNVSPLPSESGGRNCWNSDRLSNSANFILRNKGQCPRRRGLVQLLAARRPGLGSAGRARNATAEPETLPPQGPLPQIPALKSPSRAQLPPQTPLQLPASQKCISRSKGEVEK